MKKILCLLGLLILAGAGCASTPNAPVVIPDSSLNNTTPVTPVEQPTVSLADFSQPPASFPGVLALGERQGRTVLIKTSKGDITVKLYGEEAPKAASNFLVLANTGFYDNIKFHRAIKNFMIQVGDPTSKDDEQINFWGTGGPGYKFEDELGREHSTYPRGTLAMANSGPNTNGSQFFIMHKDGGLPNLYTVFGEVVDGMNVVDKIAATETTGSPKDRPLDPPYIKSMELQP